MNFKSTIALLTLMTSFNLMTSSKTFAGGDVGNGGGVHYCENRPVQEFYDLYEGKKRYGLQLDPSLASANVRETLDYALARVKLVNPQLAKRIGYELTYLSSSENFKLDTELDLPIIPDANILLRNKGCSYKQLANWDDVTNKIFVDETLYEALPEVHKAAFLLHEAIYKVSRLSNLATSKNSDITRVFVAEILSGTSFMPSAVEFKTPTDSLPENGFSSTSELTYYGVVSTIHRSNGCKEQLSVGISNESDKAEEITVTKDESYELITVVTVPPKGYANLDYRLVKAGLTNFIVSNNANLKLNVSGCFDSKEFEIKHSTMIKH